MGVYLSFLKIHLKSMIEYRGAFISHCIAKIMGWGADFLMLFVMISQVNDLDGWGPYEMLLLFGLQLFSYSMAGFFFYNIKENIPRYIQLGEFDQVLTKPTNPLFFLMCREFNTGYFSNLVVAGAAIIIAFVQLQVKISIISFVWLVLAILGGTLIFSGIMMIQIIPSFWTIRTDAIGKVDWVFQTISRYPLTIFSKVLQVALTFILPYAFINFYPAQIFISNGNLLEMPSFVKYMTLPVGIVFFCIMYLIWKKALKHYGSSGS